MPDDESCDERFNCVDTTRISQIFCRSSQDVGTCKTTTAVTLSVEMLFFKLVLRQHEGMLKEGAHLIDVPVCWAATNVQAVPYSCPITQAQRPTKAGAGMTILHRTALGLAAPYGNCDRPTTGGSCGHTRFQIVALPPER